MAGSVVLYIADALGASESGMRLLLSLFSGYPLAWLYRKPFLYSQSATVKHLYFILMGLLQCYFNFGTDLYHSLINISVIYILLKVCGGTKFSVGFAFLFNISYLVVGYLYQVIEDGEYSITWTMPHCVLTLRLTAIAFDLYDGQKRPVPKDAQDSALASCPSFLEIMGQCYFFGCFLVGPQYCMRRYLSFVHGEYSDPRTKGPPNSLMPGLERLLLGVAYIATFQLVYLYVSDDYLTTPAFQEKGLLLKCIILVIWGKTCLNKYIGSWLITEGAIIYCGLSYNGVDNNNVAQWDACTNIRVKNLETSSTLHDVIRSFNCNTNLWMAKYIYKRLRFLGNKYLSQCLTLFYLAVWHGIFSGYYMCFFLEFVYVYCESQPVVFLAKKLFSSFLLSYALVGFSLLNWQKWMSVYASVSYIGFLLPLEVTVLCWVLLKLLPRRSLQNGAATSNHPR
ncbi:hypothetical protein BaRGS_00031966, partial [Batillaria attramentaria]